MNCRNDQNQKYYCIGFTISPPKSCFLKIFVFKEGLNMKITFKFDTTLLNSKTSLLTLDSLEGWWMYDELLLISAVLGPLAE